MYNSRPEGQSKIELGLISLTDPDHLVNTAEEDENPLPGEETDARKAGS
jgi:hypothetical protein